MYASRRVAWIKRAIRERLFTAVGRTTMFTLCGDGELQTLQMAVEPLQVCRAVMSLPRAERPSLLAARDFHVQEC